jgi:hypothetical protein
MRNEAELIEAIVEAFCKLVPGLSPVTPFAKMLVKRLMSGFLTPSDLIEQTVQRKARDIAARFIAAEEAGHINRGSGHAAASDMVSILRRLTVTPQLLIDLELNSERLWKHMEEVATPFLNEASVGRAARVRAALFEISDAIAEVAVDIPAVRLAYMQEVLKRLPLRSLTSSGNPTALGP